MENEVLKNIASRRSCRVFAAEPVDRETLSRVIEAGTWAPSGHNNQKWTFVAVTSKAKLERLRVLLRDGMRDMELSPDDYIGMHDAKRAARKDGYDCFYGAPCLVLLTNERGYVNSMADCSCAAENMLLAAASLALGSCWINVPHWLDGYAPLRGYLAEECGIGADREICLSVALGKPGGKAAPAPARKSGTVFYID